MDSSSGLAAADDGVLGRRKPYLRVAVRDGRLVEQQTPVSEVVEHQPVSVDRRIAFGGEVARLIDDAKNNGCVDFANQLEDCFTEFLKGLPKAQKRAVLLMAYDAAIRGPRTSPT